MNIWLKKNDFHSISICNQIFMWTWTLISGKEINFFSPTVTDVLPAPNIDQHKSKLVKLATLVEGDPKTPFSIATTPRCGGGRYSFPWIAPPYP